MRGLAPLAVPESPFGLPLWLGFAVMFLIVVARAQLTYWIGRAAGAGLAGSRWAERVGPRRIARAENVVARYGPAAVTVSFLTIGVQTAVNLVAGTTRMPFGRYLAAMLVGSAMWAVIWTVGGVGIVWAWLTVAGRWPVVAAVVVAIAVLAGVALALRRAGRSAPADAAGSPANDPAEQEQL